MFTTRLLVCTINTFFLVLRLAEKCFTSNAKKTWFPFESNLSKKSIPPHFHVCQKMYHKLFLGKLDVENPKICNDVGIILSISKNYATLRTECYLLRISR